MNSGKAHILLLHPAADVCGHFERAIAKSGCPARVECLKQLSRETLASGKYQLIFAWDNFIMADNATFLQFYKENTLSEAVIFISNDGSTQNAVAAVRAGASDYLIKTADPELIAESVRHALKSKESRPGPFPPSGNLKKERKIITQSRVMQDLLDMVERVAESDATILINGESGTGKELLARHIHMKSGRRGGPMVAMNCAALPEQLAESELFGYEKGAFTGAGAKRRGRFCASAPGNPVAG